MTTIQLYKSRGTAGGGTTLRLYKARGVTSDPSGGALRIFEARGVTANTATVVITGPATAEPFETVILDASASTYGAGDTFSIAQVSGSISEIVDVVGPVFKVKVLAIHDESQTLTFRVTIAQPSGTLSSAVFSFLEYPCTRYALRAGAWQPVERYTMRPVSVPSLP